jgi:hypothetical protein
MLPNILHDYHFDKICNFSIKYELSLTFLISVCTYVNRKTMMIIQIYKQYNVQQLQMRYVYYLTRLQVSLSYDYITSAHNKSLLHTSDH